MDLSARQQVEWFWNSGEKSARDVNWELSEYRWHSSHGTGWRLPREHIARREEIQGWCEDLALGCSMCWCWEHEEGSGKKWEIGWPVWLGTTKREYCPENHEKKVFLEELYTTNPVHPWTLLALPSNICPKCDLWAPPPTPMHCKSPSTPSKQLPKSSAALCASTLAPPGASFPLGGQSDSLQR